MQPPPAAHLHVQHSESSTAAGTILHHSSKLGVTATATGGAIGSMKWLKATSIAALREAGCQKCQPQSKDVPELVWQAMHLGHERSQQAVHVNAAGPYLLLAVTRSLAGSIPVASSVPMPIEQHSIDRTEHLHRELPHLGSDKFSDISSCCHSIANAAICSVATTAAAMAVTAAAYFICLLCCQCVPDFICQGIQARQAPGGRTGQCPAIMLCGIQLECCFLSQSYQ
eukprot:GHRR01023393.1.p1 GENE.GHRR01023393.1~~GHRR01023393.1.p1  ORF type:complete len:227 (-),score=72.05 GHRR01023393.1:486-1166(-)